MNNYKRMLALVLIFFLALTPLASFASVSGELSYEHVRVFSEELPNRIAGTIRETNAANYIKAEFEEMGYQVMVQPFSYVRRGVTSTSQNIIALKPGLSSREVIVGAHYDSVSVGRGADDNGSGVAVMLEAAERLQSTTTAYTIRFIAFGAEEVGLQGSNYFARSLTPEQVDNTAAMINLDTLLAGDFMYVYSGLGGDGWVRDQALGIANSLGLSVQTNPGLNPSYPAGETGDWSDHAPFRRLGIPVAYFEATNWTIGDLDGYDQTVLFGPIMHSGRDSLSFVEEHFPGRAMDHMSTFSSLLYHLLLQLQEPAQVDRTVNKGVVTHKEVWQANATIPFKFDTFDANGHPQMMENITLRIFDRHEEIAVFSGKDVKALGKGGQYMVNINTKHLGLSDGLYIVLIEYLDQGKPVVTSHFLELK